MIKKFEILGTSFFVNLFNGFSSVDEKYILDSMQIKAAQSPIFKFPMYKKITFCLEHTNSCNLKCNYCFNKNKNNKKIIFDEKYEDFLDKLFLFYKQCDRYYIDLSSDAEPLTNIDFIKSLAIYVNKKQEEIRKEILITFVTNGTLLTKDVVQFLQNSGIIFGISLDGDKEIHDLNRRDCFGQITYDKIISNVLNIEHREFLGCAVTLSSKVFSLVDSLKNLNKIFPTVSFKFVRLKNEFNYSIVDKWSNEYNKLTLFLLDEINKYNFKYLFCLLNGDDYFGKFICLSFLGAIPYNRCDAANGRIFIDIDLNFYPCVPLKQYPSKYNMKVDKDIHLNVSELEKVYELTRYNSECSKCDFHFLCGGECLVEKELNGGNNIYICEIKKHLILLSKFLYLSLVDDEEKFNIIYNFIVDKYRKKAVSERFKEIVRKNNNLSFKECNSLYYQEINSDNNQQLRY